MSTPMETGALLAQDEAVERLDRHYSGIGAGTEDAARRIAADAEADAEADADADADAESDSIPCDAEGDPGVTVPTWGPLVERIRAGDSTAMSELYQTFSRGIRYYMCRQLGPQELDDKVHDAFMIVIQAIQRNELRDPEKLMGFVRTVVRRQVAGFIDHAVHTRRDFADMEMGGRVPDARDNPEQTAIRDERNEIMRKVLGGISRRDREILTRFYLEEQSQEQICEEMNLTETQFRLLKSRAKARFGELGKRRVARPGMAALFVRKVTASGN